MPIGAGSILLEQLSTATPETSGMLLLAQVRGFQEIMEISTDHLPSDDATCATNCALDGADYGGTYGISSSGDSLKLGFVTNGPYSKNIGSRTYLMESDTTYKMFNVLGGEFTFDVDVSNLPCGLNGALYFVSMDADGGMSKFPTNKAGAKYGTGYCDSQCPRDLKFIDGAGNVEGWAPAPSDANAGVGQYGSLSPCSSGFYQANISL